MTTLTFELLDSHTTLSDTDFNQFCLLLYEWYKIYNYPLEVPPVDLVKLHLSLPPEPKSKTLSIIAKIDGKIVAISRIFLNLDLQNEFTCLLRVTTAPDCRNQGIGTKVLQYSLSQLPKTVNKVKFNTRNDEYHEGTRTWMDLLFIKLGGKMVLSDRRSGAHLPDFNLTGVQEAAERHYQETIAKGYTIIFVDSYQFPENFDVEDFVHSMVSIWNDMPRDEITAEDELLSVDEFYQMVRRYKAEYDVIWMFVCLKQNKTVGLTLTLVEKLHSSLAIQDDTGVISEHRGNGLGLALKCQMLQKLLTDPTTKKVTHWVTHNAHSNEHMIRINTNLKYQPIATFNLYEFDRTELEQKLMNNES